MKKWILTLMISPWAMAGTLGVVNKTDGTASLIDVETGQARTFQVEFLPHEIVVGKDFAVVSNYGSAHIRAAATFAIAQVTRFRSSIDASRLR